MLVAVVWPGSVFGGEIQETADQGNLARIKALGVTNPELIFDKDAHGMMALDFAAVAGHKDMDMAEFCLPMALILIPGMTKGERLRGERVQGLVEIIARARRMRARFLDTPKPSCVSSGAG
jgi:hypothetical protein